MRASHTCTIVAGMVCISRITFYRHIKEFKDLFCIVQKFEMDPLVRPECPGEKEPWHAGIGFDVVCEQIFDSFVTAEL